MRNRNNLTPREKEVISLAAQGKKYKEIAKDMEISDFTVRSHLTNIRMKLGVKKTSIAISIVTSRDVVFS